MELPGTTFDDPEELHDLIYEVQGEPPHYIYTPRRNRERSGSTRAAALSSAPVDSTDAPQNAGFSFRQVFLLMFLSAIVAALVTKLNTMENSVEVRQATTIREAHHRLPKAKVQNGSEKQEKSETHNSTVWQTKKRKDDYIKDPKSTEDSPKAEKDADTAENTTKNDQASTALDKHLREVRTQALLPSSMGLDEKAEKSHCPWNEPKILNSRCDVQVLFRRLIARVPFAFAHFNDGEIVAMSKTDGTTDRGWQTLSAELQQVMLEVFRAEAPRGRKLVYGIPCPHEFKDASKFANEELDRTNSTAERTLATVFINENYRDSRSVLIEYIKRNPDRRVHMVVSEKADMENFSNKTGIKPTSLVRIPAVEGFPRGYYDNINNTANHKPGDLVILCAGPLGRVLAVKWFISKPETTYLELGSFFDLDLFDKSIGASYYTRQSRGALCGKTTPMQKELLLNLVNKTATDHFLNGI